MRRVWMNRDADVREGISGRKMLSINFRRIETNDWTDFLTRSRKIVALCLFPKMSPFPCDCSHSRFFIAKSFLVRFPSVVFSTGVHTQTVRPRKMVLTGMAIVTDRGER